VTCGTLQLQLVLVSAAKKPRLAQVAASVVVSSLDIGSQNTEKPYAMPMQRWIASAAGGTSQRLKRGPAMVRSLAKNPGLAPAAADETTASGTPAMSVLSLS